MNQCISVKNSRSQERCPRHARHGVLCGTHARMAQVRVWLDPQRLQECALRIQRVVRGFLIRKFQALQGAGLRPSARRQCTNEEEFHSGEPLANIGPWDYFAIEEGPKTFGFNIKSLHMWVFGKANACNPYTREPITAATWQRLWRLIRMRDKLHGRKHWHELLHDKSQEDRCLLTLQDLDNRFCAAALRGPEDLELHRMPASSFILACRELCAQLDEQAMASRATHDSFLVKSIERLQGYQWQRISTVERALRFARLWLKILDDCPNDMLFQVTGWMVHSITMGVFIVTLTAAHH